MGSESEDGQSDMEEEDGREYEESRVENRKSWRLNDMEGRCESDRGGDEVYPATFGNEEKTGLKLDRRRKTNSTKNNNLYKHLILFIETQLLDKPLLHHVLMNCLYSPTFAAVVVTIAMNLSDWQQHANQTFLRSRVIGG